jgi:hypothetical protein
MSSTQEGFNMNTGTNAKATPQYEGQIVKFKSPHADVVLFDIARLNTKYNRLEWWALNEPTEEQQLTATWSN